MARNGFALKKVIPFILGISGIIFSVIFMRATDEFFQKILLSPSSQEFAQKVMRNCSTKPDRLGKVENYVCTKDIEQLPITNFEKNVLIISQGELNFLYRLIIMLSYLALGYYGYDIFLKIRNQVIVLLNRTKNKSYLDKDKVE